MKKISNLDRLRRLTTRKDKISLVVLFLMTLSLSIIETLSVALIMPFISFASNPSLVTQNKYGNAIYKMFDFATPFHFIYVFSIALIVFYVFRVSYNTFYNYRLNLFVAQKTHSLSCLLFQKVLNLNYLNFTTLNSDNLRRLITQDTTNTSTYLRNFLMLCSEICTMCILYTTLLAINWKMTLVLTFILSVNVVLITKTISLKLKKKGEENMKINSAFLNILSSTFGNFKFIKIKSNQSDMTEKFLDYGLKQARNSVVSQTLMLIPKNLLESIGFSALILSIVYVLYRYQDASAVVPIISMFALALYRVLPSINRVIDNFNSMKLNSKSLEVVYNEITHFCDDEGGEKIDFHTSITLKHISFEYLKNKPIISNYNLTIHKGEKVAFVGPSGAGKSTLVDIITGFYTPKQGEIYVDQTKLTQNNIRAWRRKIGYIPQTIYLFDGSVGENIAFGSEYDEKKIIRACQIANIYDFLQEHEGIQTMVGDGGIKLSGGQKQRIGIARAIYDNPEILVLDEATSALDNETEAKIMDEIYDLSADKTLLVIAHRLSTIERCDRQIQVNPHKKS